MKSLARSAAYKALDLITGGRGVPRVIGGETFRMPARWSRYYDAGYEPGTFDFLRRRCRPGDTVMDIGAHIGLFTVSMARLVGPSGRVLSFEPTPYTCGVLREMVRINGCGSTVEVNEKAVSARAGRARFFDTGDVISNANSLVRTGRGHGSITVETVGVDEVVPPGTRVGLLKIDVEGAELDVLRGAGRTIERCRPAVHLSLHPPQIGESGGSLRDVWNLLCAYRMVPWVDGVPMPEDPFCSRTDLFDAHVTPAEGRA
jgi:FkbM family methyltransferase